MDREFASWSTRSLISDLKNNEGNSYPELEALKKRFKILDDADDTRYIDTDRIIGRLVARHTDTNFALWYSIKVFMKTLGEQITNNPKLNLVYIERVTNLLITYFRDSSPSIEPSIELIFADLEKEIIRNPKLKILRKVQVLLKSVAGERVEGGSFRAWSTTGVYHFSRRCKLYPERVKPKEMKQIICYETREEAERKHKPCKICQSAESSLEKNNTEFLGEEPE